MVATSAGTCVAGNTPVTMNVVAVVEMSRGEFDAAQDSFLEGLAAATAVDVDQVTIYESCFLYRT